MISRPADLMVLRQICKYLFGCNRSHFGVYGDLLSIDFSDCSKSQVYGAFAVEAQKISGADTWPPISTMFSVRNGLLSQSTKCTMTLFKLYTIVLGC